MPLSVERFGGYVISLMDSLVFLVGIVFHSYYGCQDIGGLHDFASLHSYHGFDLFLPFHGFDISAHFDSLMVMLSSMVEILMLMVSMTLLVFMLPSSSGI